MQKLAELGCISIQSNNHYSIISICNWDDYQGENHNQVTAKEQPSNSQVTAKEQPRNTDKNNKNVKNNKNTETDIGAEKPAPKSIKFNPLSFRPAFISEKSWADLVALRRAKKAAQTERAYQSIVNEILKAINKGFTADDCINKMCNRNWTGFEAQWMENSNQSGQKNGFKTKQQINDEIQDIGIRLNEQTGFSPYREIETTDSRGDVNQNIRALPQQRTHR